MRASRHSFNPQEFAARKPEGGFRIFILGGSSAYGFPWGAEGSFSGPLEVGLVDALPNRRVEVINAAAMSYGSHRLRVLVQELLRYEPDLFIIYSGHNEFVEREFFSDLLARTRRLDGVQAALARSRFYSLLSRLREASLRAEGASGADLLGLDVGHARELVESTAEKLAAGKQLRENLEAVVSAIADQSVPVILCTVPSNLTGWAPNDSLFRAELSLASRQIVERLLEEARSGLAAGRAETAAKGLEEARALAPEHAEVHFRLGHAYLALERGEDALAEFRLALETDARPSRALAAFNDHIRSLAHDRRIPLLDVDQLFQTAVGDSLLGFNLFQDYVHPKPQAHKLIARGLYRTILELGLSGKRMTYDPAAFRRAAGAIDHTQAVVSGPEDGADDEKTPALLFNLAVVLEHQGVNDEAIRNYYACLERAPGHEAARLNLGLLLSREGRHQEAARELTRLVENSPQDVRARAALAKELIEMGRLDDAIAQLRVARQLAPDASESHERLGLSLMNAGRYRQAEAPLRRSVELEPDNHRYRWQYGAALMLLGKLEEAEEAFSKSLELEPRQVDSRNGLAFIALERGQLEEAERLYRWALEHDPVNRRARDGLRAVAEHRARATR
jgi:tetratricopeptide (TPR) repeat protein